jgi:hypothetical protein
MRVKLTVQRGEKCARKNLLDSKEKKEKEASNPLHFCSKLEADLRFFPVFTGG